ncbi:MAG: Gamma-DL-glutamyl hydrolase [Firmicutes bacterium]|nr:Gamma-DL-glutamyl hydrolase [candidate division NPL-UPA2 bacterium]
MRKLLAAALVFTLLLLPISSLAAVPIGQQIARLALEQRGVPFRFGGESPDGFDASGLLVYVFGQFGAGLPRTTAEQATVTAVRGVCLSLPSPCPLDLIQPR